MAEITVAQIKAALMEKMGILSFAAEKLGCSRQNLYQRVQRSPELQGWIEEIEQKMIDVSEAVVLEAIVKKDKQMTRWYMERKGRSRGYVTQTALANPDGSALSLPPSVAITVNYIAGETTDEVI